MNGVRSVIIQHIRPDDLPEVARIHIEAFPSSAMSLVGSDVVEAYYSWQLDDRHQAVAFGARRDSRLVGYVFAGSYEGALSGFLLHRWVTVGRSVLRSPRLLRHAQVRRRAVFGARVILRKATRYLRSVLVAGARTAQSDPHGVHLRGGSERRNTSNWGILAIAVKVDELGSGVADLLMADAERIALEHNVSFMNLTVDPQNRRAVRFYERNGWARSSVDGEWRGSMTKVPGLAESLQRGAGQSEPPASPRSR